MKSILLMWVTLLCIFAFCNKSPTNVQEEIEKASIFIASIPPVADIYADDILIGRTNVALIELTSGTHNMSFKKDSLKYDTLMTLKPGKNPSVMIRLY